MAETGMGSEPGDAEHRLGFSPGSKFRDPDNVQTFKVFVSSAGDVTDSRRRARRLIDEVFNDLLAQRSLAQLYPDMWERRTPRRLAAGKTVNEEFVDKAVHAHAVLVLLKTQLGEGTREEVEAVLELDAEEGAFSVLRFADPDGTDDPAALDTFVGRLRAAGTVLYEETGAEGADDAWISLTRTIGDFAFAALEKVREMDREGSRNLVP